MDFGKLRYTTIVSRNVFVQTKYKCNAVSTRANIEISPVLFVPFCRTITEVVRRRKRYGGLVAAVRIRSAAGLLDRPGSYVRGERHGDAGWTR